MPDKACSHYLIWSWKQSSGGGRARIIFFHFTTVFTCKLICQKPHTQTWQKWDVNLCTTCSGLFSTDQNIPSHTQTSQPSANPGAGSSWGRTCVRSTQTPLAQWRNTALSAFRCAQLLGAGWVQCTEGWEGVASYYLPALVTKINPDGFEKNQDSRKISGK